MSEIKLVLSDLDDTLAPHMQHTVSQAVRQAIIDVENSGVKVAVVTGRAYIHAKGTLEVLGVEGPCVFDGGATVADSVTGEVLWRQWLDAKSINRIIETIGRHCTEAYFTQDCRMQNLKGMIQAATFEDAPCVFAVADTMEDINKAGKELKQVKGIRYFTGMGTHPDTDVPMPAMQITHEFADKFHGVEALRKLVKIGKDETLAIGDGSNDVPLFENAGLKIAMGNAGDALKNVANDVVGTLDNDGFAEAMNKYVLHK